VKRGKIAIRPLAGAGLAVAVLIGGPAPAQQPPPKPPAVGIVAAARRPVTPSSEYVGRIQAPERVNLVARVAAFLEQRLFTEGAEVKKGEPLYRLEQGPFLADVHAKQAAIAQLKAQLQNAETSLYRAKALLNTSAGQQSTVDNAVANEQALQAQILGAEAQLQQSQINLGYTDIRAPIDGKIGRTAVTIGNYVNPNSGVLATIVSQDPMYVVFGVSSRVVIDLRRRAATTSAAPVVIKIRLPDGRIYDQTGSLDFIDNVVGGSTDAIILRGVLSNTSLSNAKPNDPTRELVDGEFVSVIVEDAQPVEATTIPRAAVLSDQGGDYVYVVDGRNKAVQRRVQLGPSLSSDVAVMSGLHEGENVVVEGVQRVRPGEAVSPALVGGQAPEPAGGQAPASAGASAPTPPRS
jgi:membrane fusion protein, multidrug efflux system